MIDIGLQFDKSLTKKYPEINERLKQNNGNMCNVMYMEFDKNDEDMKAEQLSCGHQFSVICWKNHLKVKVKDDGA